jgi:hypothetical protein
MASCDNCRFVRDRNPRASIPDGWCHRMPPALLPDGRSMHRMVALVSWCGEHQWSLGGIWRLFFGAKENPRRYP